MIRHIVLHAGYAETSAVSPMIFTATESVFSDPLVAVKQLALDLFVKYLDDSHRPFDPSTMKRAPTCCDSDVNAGKRYCGECGNRLDDQRYVIELDDYMEWLDSLWSTDADGWGAYLLGWDIWSCVRDIAKDGPDSILEFLYHGEYVPIVALDPETVPRAYRGCVLEWQNDSEFGQYLSLEDIEHACGRPTSPDRMSGEAELSARIKELEKGLSFALSTIDNLAYTFLDEDEIAEGEEEIEWVRELIDQKRETFDSECDGAVDGSVNGKP